MTNHLIKFGASEVKHTQVVRLGSSVAVWIAAREHDLRMELPDIHQAIDLFEQLARKCREQAGRIECEQVLSGEPAASGSQATTATLERQWATEADATN